MSCGKNMSITKPAPMLIKHARTAVLIKPHSPNSEPYFKITVPTPIPPIIEIITANEYPEENRLK
ncbi:hypothetical protein D3C81_2310230 [compost metagenome]